MIKLRAASRKGGYTVLTSSGIIISSTNKTKKMLKNKNMIKKSLFTLRSLALFAVAITVLGSSVVVRADQFDAQINALNEQNSNTQGQVSSLQAQASSYQDAISKLQLQINAIQTALYANQARQADLQTKIEEAKAKIAQQKIYLGESIKAMYVDGDLSTIEQLASSNNLSDFIDKEEYRTSVQNKVDTIIKEIAVLQAEMQRQKIEVDALVVEQKRQNDSLASAQSQQQSMLTYNEGQQSAFNQQISGNKSKIQELRAQQIAANARFSGGAPGTGAACGGGYPAQWCNISMDSVIDSWGMYNRECVSYTAFRVAASGRHMPYWGGIGNAWEWAFSSNWGGGSMGGNAADYGIPVDRNPRAGDVAISNQREYGHAMYVESVNGDGTINISQYNANWDGRYSTRNNVDPSGLAFIHF